MISWLRIVHELGLTELTDEEIRRYEQMKINQQGKGWKLTPAKKEIKQSVEPDIISPSLEELQKSLKSPIEQRQRAKLVDKKTGKIIAEEG